MIYVVQQGDTLAEIAQIYQLSVETIAYDNQIPYPYRLAVGQSLFLPSHGRTSLQTDNGELSDESIAQSDNRNLSDDSIAQRHSAEKSSAIYVNGYAYPFIEEWTLDQTLPYLTDLSIFSYGFTTEGNLIFPVLDDQWMIEAAWKYHVRPILTLTPLDEQGVFNNRLISGVVNHEAARENLINQLLEIMGEKGFAGVDIDFEYILAEDREAFTAFVQRITQQMNARGYVVSVALAPKTSATQQGLLYEGKDYQTLGEAANSVLLMTYEWGYTYGPPMAVAPINKVREVVEYALTEMTPGKINMGIPNYGYDWTLPYVRGKTRARTIGNVEAWQLAVEQGASIQFDEVAQSPYFRYTENGIEHEVWFEDVRSLNAKFDLVQEYGLRGVGYWQIMRLFRANWLLLENRFAGWTQE